MPLLSDPDRRRLDLAVELEREFYRRGWPRLKYAATYREADHPRDDLGRWAPDNGGGSGGGSQQEAPRQSRKQLEKTHWKLVDKALAGAREETPELAEHFERSLRAAFRGLSDTAVERLNQKVTAYHFYATVEEVTSAYRAVTGRKRPKFVEGFFDQETGRVHLNGGFETSGNWAADPAAAVYAHEIGHALDRGHELTDNKEWRDIWAAEIHGGVLGKAGDISPAEGFATFAEVALLNQPMAEQLFPQATAFWKDRGLIS